MLARSRRRTGEVSKKNLAQDDINALCAIYPPGSLQGSCDPTPRGGLQLDCSLPQSVSSGGGCSAGSGREKEERVLAEWHGCLGSAMGTAHLDDARIEAEENLEQLKVDANGLLDAHIEPNV